MLRRAKQIQLKASDKSDKAKSIWKERYVDERKKTTQLEQESTKSRDTLEKLHRELLAKIELGFGNNSLTGKTGLPSRKLKCVVQKDVKILRQELVKKKIQITLTRNQEQSATDNSKRNSCIKVV
ncbi:uncharacterized protein LOC111085504 [Limulus polyphemus]|uniref:Uncharacterized protein LOC111085504 n=1 Tax=Limulus polyphemus TaxID=6850 RepID=A0ABM1S8Z6_LIMPO|nr:uncharacterized protein LOC111085504 [Limulus polyphemus]